MEAFIDKIAEGIVARIAGPMSLRFLFQPLVAVILGIRDGIMDARANIEPFIIEVILNPENRKGRLAGALTSLLKPMIVATVFDMIAQYLIFERIRVVPAVIVGVFVMTVPYALARGITNRIVSNNKQQLYNEKESMS